MTEKGKNKMKKNYSRLFIRKCTQLDLDKICDLQKEVLGELNDKEILRENTQDMFVKCVQTPNLTIGIFDGLELVGLAIFVDESGNDEDLSRDLVKHTVSLAVNFKLVIVRKEYRGNGFQNALMWILEKSAYNQGFTHMCTTVSDKNIYSLHNIQAMGYQYDHNALKYGGLSRKVFVKDISKSVSSYNKMILSIISSIEGKREPNALVIEGINFDRCFEGEISIANTGDIIEYEDIDTAKIYYALLVKKFTPMILMFNPEKGCLSFMDFSYNISSLKLKKVWINTVRSTGNSAD